MPPALERAVVVYDVATHRRRPRRFCTEHAHTAGRNRRYGLPLVRRPEPIYRFTFRAELEIVVGPARSDEEAWSALARLLRPLASCARPLADDVEAITLEGEPELLNGPLLSAWEDGVADREDRRGR